MANQLLSVSGLDAARPSAEQEKGVAEWRAYRYRSDCPQGEIFVGKEAIAAAEKDGWCDSPAGVPEMVDPEPESEPELPDESEPEPEGDEDAGE